MRPDETYTLPWLSIDDKSSLFITHAQTPHNSTGQLRLFVDGAQRDAKALPASLATARLRQCLTRGRPVYLGGLGDGHDHWEG